MPIFNLNFSSLQLQALMIVGIIMGASILFCFIVGEITRNNSQMDKLWSILPIAYTWVPMFLSGFNWRCVVIAVITTLWGVRLTINFAKKGAYSIKFWTGEEDYRWRVVRSWKAFKDNKFTWALFDLFFICIFQNVVVLGMTLPTITVMESTTQFNFVDAIAIVVALGALVYETIADHQQMKFQTKKWDMIKSGMKLEELPEPYNLGFNTTGLWNYSRHPNYIGEQLIWIGVYLFVLGARIAFFDITIIACILLICVFIGSSRLAENISSSKYPLYKDYQKKVFKYLPFRRYRK